MNLLTVDTLEQAREKLLACWERVPMPTCTVTLEEALGRVTAEDVLAPDDVPNFYRSTVDGYAVVAADTQGASESIPTFLTVVEEVAMGRPARETVCSGTCAYVPTGGMLPQGADAMVMVEYTENFHGDEVAVYQSVAQGAGVVVPGEEVRKGAVLIPKGTALNPAHVGALAAAGIWEITVYRPWRVAILSTGDELVHPAQPAGPAQVRDVNTWALAALTRACGLQIVLRRTLPDREELLEQALTQAKEQADLVLTSGGSSQGKADYTCRLMDRVCDRGVMTHGLSVKPGKPTILAFDGASQTLMIGLPGHPVAALMIYQALGVWLWKRLTGQREQKPRLAEMALNIPGAPGKTTFVWVKLQTDENGRQTAIPVLGKSGLMGTLVDADGYLVLDRNKEGLRKGEPVEIYRLGI